METELEIFTKWLRKLRCEHVISTASDWFDITERNRPILNQIKIDRCMIDIDEKNKRFRLIIEW